MSLSTINSEPDNSAGTSADWRRYLAWYLLTLLLACALVAGFNAIVDPQARILIVDKPGFNQVKVALETNSRKGKASALRQCNYDTIILGTSRAETGIATDYPALREAAPYNAALKAATMYEMRRVAEYAMRQHKLKTVLLSLDFVAFNSTEAFNEDFADSAFAETAPLASLARYLVSVRTLRESWATLQLNARSELGMCNDNGEHKRQRELEVPRKAFDFILRRYARGQYGPYVVGETHFQNLAAVLQELTDADVAVYAFISPVHVTHLEVMAEMGVLDEYEDWKRRLVQVFADANRNLPPQRQAVLWDFGEYNEITTETVPPADSQQFMRWYYDSAHFNQTVGNLMLDRMFGLQTTAPATAAPFGAPLTADNVETVIAAGRRASARYRSENPDEIARLQEMLRSNP